MVRNSTETQNVWDPLLSIFRFSTVIKSHFFQFFSQLDLPWIPGERDLENSWFSTAKIQLACNKIGMTTWLHCTDVIYSRIDFSKKNATTNFFRTEDESSLYRSKVMGFLRKTLELCRNGRNQSCHNFSNFNFNSILKLRFEHRGKSELRNTL